MDASAYLQKQGWRGSGHSLDHSNRGITKPLLVSKKVDVLGVGLNKHAAVSDQWWLRAYDQGLKTLGTGQESALAQAQRHGVNRGGLYGRFVKGEGVPGTFGESGTESSSGVLTPTFEMQNPGDASVVVAAPLDRKRKRAEGQVEKCARRKVESDHDDEKEEPHVAKHAEFDPQSADAKRAKKALSKERKALKKEKQVSRKLEKKLSRTTGKEASAEVHQKGKKGKTAPKAKKQAQPEIVTRLEGTTGAEQMDGFVAGADEINLAGVAKTSKHPPKVENRVTKDATTALRDGTSIEDFQAKTAALQASERATEQEKIDRYRAMKQGLTQDQYREKLAAGEILPPSTARTDLGPEKLAAYKERAAAKGVSLEDYIKRREDKYAAKQAEKLPTATAIAQTEPLSFVIDTEGTTEGTTAGATTTETTSSIQKSHGDKHGGKAATKPKKSRGRTKAELREKATIELLSKSREAAPSGNGRTTLKTGQTVTLVKTKTRTGAFSKAEMTLARREVRRADRVEKRANKKKAKAIRKAGKQAKAKKTGSQSKA